jgi:hypothetical protein
MANKTKEQKMKALIKWAKAVLAWYEENYGGIRPMDDDGIKKPPPPPPRKPE